LGIITLAFHPAACVHQAIVYSGFLARPEPHIEAFIGSAARQPCFYHMRKTRATA
jgi:hypothetical protein